MSEDWEYDEDDCPKCGATLASRHCSSFHDELDEEDEWPTDSLCDECNGDGHVEWCRACGWDVTFGQFLSPQYEAEWQQKQVQQQSRVAEMETAKSGTEE